MAMFSVIISEKGGAERRESYDRTEINVGRVQGNELMLPKGNVSKRHARLLFRDGRFIVTDLKSARRRGTKSADFLGFMRRSIRGTASPCGPAFAPEARLHLTFPDAAV